MKRWSILVVLVFGRMLSSLPAAAEEPPATHARALVEQKLVQPLAARERDQSRFSRARLPAQERRVRILDDGAHKDSAGNAFVRFAIDARHGIFAADDEKTWRLEAVAGCVYVERGEIFVKSGDDYRPAAFLLGKNLKPAGEATCRDASPVAAKTP